PSKRHRYRVARAMVGRPTGLPTFSLKEAPCTFDSPREEASEMGKLLYGDAQDPINIDDRALAHLKIVIATKLRRNESFTLSWRHPEGSPEGRSTIWIDPSIPMRFVFDDAEPPELSRQWIEDLAHSAHSTGGIVLVEEHLEVPA